MIRKDDLNLLQVMLGVRLPEDYQKVLLAYPQWLSILRRDMGWKQESPADRELLNDPWQLLKDNHCVRMLRTPWTEDDGPWPDRYFVVGNNECGDYWTLNLSEPGSSIYFYDHEKGLFTKQFDTVDAFADWLAQDIKKWNETRATKIGDVQRID